MSDLSFEAKNKTLSEVLFSTRKYLVPRFQRPYAWTSDEVSQFWEDLSTNDDPYFIGSIIVNKEDEKTTGFADVIDGQQRLLTTTILIAALRDLAKPLDPEKAKLYQRQDIAIEDRDGREAYRIVPDETLSDFFLEYIQKDTNDIDLAIASTSAEKRVKDNYFDLRARVESELSRYTSPEAKLTFLDDIRTKIANLVVINVEIAREEDAYEIFETTNARGLELSVADLLKNLIFKQIKADGSKDSARDMWQEITSEIEATGTDLRKFIRYYWISRYNFISEKKLYREIKRTILSWQDLLLELIENSHWYNKLHEGNEQDFGDIKSGRKIFKSVLALRLMQITQCHVFLMAVLRNIDRLGTDPTKVIQFIERFSFQYSAVCKMPTNRIEKTYSKYALKVETVLAGTKPEDISAKVQTVFHELKAELSELAPSEQRFVEDFCKISYRNSENSRLLNKYVLSEIDTYYKNTDEHRIDFNNVNLEHLLPQTPHKDWNLKKTQIKGYVNKLGNLTLLSKRINSSVQNLTIDKKLPELEKSELAVTKNVVERIKSINCWNEASINQRQEEMAELGFNQIWTLGNAKTKPSNQSPPPAPGTAASSAQTPSPAKRTASDETGESDFVVYHNPDVMGYSATAAQPLSVVTNKPAGAAMGQRVWLITGQGNPRKYYIRSWFIVEEISSGEDRGFARRLTGNTGEVFDPLVPIDDDSDWWREFRKSQGNFAFGFSPIKGRETVTHLEALIQS